MLFCATGSVGFRPEPLPSGFELNFAVAVVEINSPSAVDNVALREFSVFDSAGKPTPKERIVAVERFVRTGVATGASFAYYLNDDAVDRASPWDGSLPAGDVRLRIRVALPRDPGDDFPGKCRVAIGPYLLEGPVDGIWPT